MERCARCGREYARSPHECGQAAIETLQIDRDDPADFGAESSLYEAGALIGQYRLLGLLGEGAIGRVYLAEHTELGRRVALKMVRSELARKRSVVERFFGEARAVNQIHHKNIVEITDFVREDVVGRSYYIMELLEGCTLRGLLERGAPIPVERALGIVRQICSALEAVHATGIVHRDIKPENVFLCEREGTPDFVKLLDFGAAKLSNLHDERLQHQTRAGALVGTPHYMSPEQTYGAEVDHRADIYALGVLLYEMLVGRVPFDGDTGHVLLAHRSVAPERPRLVSRAIPERLESLILRCLEKERAKRPQSMEEVSLALEPKRRSSRGAWLAISGAAVLATASIAAFMLHPAATPSPPVVIVVPPGSASPPPPLAPPPALPAQVRVTFHSKPPGAEVRIGRTVVGTTPLTTALARSDAPVTYELRLQRHAVLADVLHPTSDATVSVVLAEVPKRKRVRRSKPARPPPVRAKRTADPIGLSDMRDPFSGSE